MPEIGQSKIHPAICALYSYRHHGYTIYNIIVFQSLHYNENMCFHNKYYGGNWRCYNSPLKHFLLKLFGLHIQVCKPKNKYNSTLVLTHKFLP